VDGHGLPRDAAAGVTEHDEALPAQVRLLRVLQEGTFSRVGGSEVLRGSVRVITATHRDLRAMCTDGTFRLDLWYRFGAVTVRIPPLRDRPGDIPALALHFAHAAGVRLTGTPLAPTARELDALRGSPWPGNVRELAAVIECAAILGGGHRLAIEAALGDAPPPSSRAVLFTAPPFSTRAPSSATAVAESSERRSVITLEETVRKYIEEVLAMTRGRIEGPNGAARLLDVNPHSLQGKMRKLRIDWARCRSG